MGFGLFNLVEGIVDHHILGIHHVNETVPPEQWIYWDVGFLVWGALMCPTEQAAPSLAVVLEPSWKPGTLWMASRKVVGSICV